MMTSLINPLSSNFYSLMRLHELVYENKLGVVFSNTTECGQPFVSLQRKRGKVVRIFYLIFTMYSFICTTQNVEYSIGLYAGLGVHLMKVVPNSAIMFLTYEVVNSWLSQVHISD